MLAVVVAGIAGELIREKDARIAELEAAARNLINLIGNGRGIVRNGRAARECVVPEEAITQLRRSLDP